MGLDMYLEGKTFNWEFGDKRPQKDGFPVKGVTLELGYWRKHPDLHGYIVETFADGVDDCKPIHLNADDIRQIIQAIKDKKLPHTEGFFFGESDGSEDEESIQIFERALDWLEKKTDPVKHEPVKIGDFATAVMIKPDDFDEAKEGRDVFYEASW